MPKYTNIPSTVADELSNRLDLMMRRLISVDNTVLSLGNEIAFIKHKMATIQSQYAVGVREEKKKSNLTPEELLKDLLRGKTNIDVTSWFDGNPDKKDSTENYEQGGLNSKTVAKSTDNSNSTNHKKGSNNTS